MARCWHTAERQLTSPPMSRTTISGSSAIVIVNQSPGLGIRDARPTHSQSWANSESYSKRRNSSFVYNSAGSVAAWATSEVDWSSDSSRSCVSMLDVPIVRLLSVEGSVATAARKVEADDVAGPERDPGL